MIPLEQPEQRPNETFVSAQAVPYLEKWVKDLVAGWLARNEGKDGTQDADWDPNDIVIFDGFVLPVLQDARGKGFKADQMIDKGYRFLMSNIAAVVTETVPEQDRAARGELIKLGYAFECAQLLERCGFTPDENVWENQGYFKHHIDALARLNALR